MKPPTGSQPPQSPSPAPKAPASTPQQPNSAPPAPTGTVPPRGEDFDISTLPNSTGSGDKKLFPAHWNRAWMIVAGLLGVYCLWFFAYGMGAHAQKPLPIGPIIANSAAPDPATATATVHVAGAVARPGVYSLNATARIADAISQAGGVTPDADTTNLNLAAFVQDGAQIVVPVRAAPTSNSASGTGVAPASPLGIATPAPPAPVAPIATISPAAAQRAAQVDYLRAHPIDLNQASSFELQQLPGVGPAMAQEIIDYRTNNGLFRSVSDLDNVKGIGEKRMETLKDLGRGAMRVILAALWASMARRISARQRALLAPFTAE